MANPEHLKAVKMGEAEIAALRKRLDGSEVIDLSGADLRHAYLGGADLRDANLSNTDLSGANLSGAILIDANLSDTNLSNTDLSRAILGHAMLGGANLIGANLNGANLNRADLSNAGLGFTVFANTDLSHVKGLETVVHLAASCIGIDTIYKSKGKIAETFLRGCGVPEGFISYIPSLIGAMQPIEYYSCFLSHASADGEFCQRLHGRMQQEKLRVWFAPEDMRAGKKVEHQIDEAIRVHDKLLLVISDASMKSNWVAREIQKARRKEKQTGKAVLFPVSIVAFDTIRKWELLDTDTGEDLARIVREYHIPTQFEDWKDHDAFEKAFGKLIAALKAEDVSPEPVGVDS